MITMTRMVVMTRIIQSIRITIPIPIRSVCCSGTPGTIVQIFTDRIIPMFGIIAISDHKCLCGLEDTLYRRFTFPMLDDGIVK